MRSKGVGRLRLRNMPQNLVRMEDLLEIQLGFRSTLAREIFLLYDSFKNDWNGDWIIVYATPENLRNLFRSNVWFVDGTFRCSPSIFHQIFTIRNAKGASGLKSTITPVAVGPKSSKRKGPTVKKNERKNKNIVLRYPEYVQNGNVTTY